MDVESVGPVAGLSGAGEDIAEGAAGPLMARREDDGRASLASAGLSAGASGA